MVVGAFYALFRSSGKAPKKNTACIVRLLRVFVGKHTSWGPFWYLVFAFLVPVFFQAKCKERLRSPAGPLSENRAIKSCNKSKENHHRERQHGVSLIPCSCVRFAFDFWAALAAAIVSLLELACKIRQARESPT